MKSNRAYAVLSLLTLFFSQACVNATDLFLYQRQELEQAKALWDSQASLSSYEFEYERFGTPDLPGTVYPWTITVETNLAPTAVDGNSNPILATHPPSLTWFFQMIQTQLDMGNVNVINVLYNPQRGYPELVYMKFNDGTTYDVEMYKAVFYPVVPDKDGDPNRAYKLNQMVQAQLLWRSKYVRNYRYMYQETLNADAYHFPWTVTVLNEVSATGIDSNGDVVVWSDPRPYFVQELFDRIQTAFRKDIPVIEVRYNTFYGHPEEIFLVTDKVGVGGTFEATLSGFTEDF